MDLLSLHFLFPAHPLRPRLVEPTFKDQYDSLQHAGFTVSIADEATIEHGRGTLIVPSGSIVVYRGWMLDASAYQLFTKQVAAASARLITSPANYICAHHLPNWYEALRDLTPETVVWPEKIDYIDAFNELGWDQAFVKDFVKSVTATGGSIVRSASDLREAIEYYETYRGQIEGGLCLRRVENLLPETERRYFVLRGKAYGPFSEEDIPQLVCRVQERIALPFFSVDVIQRDDGQQRVVEIGDGQVSDLKEWSAERFTAMWKDARDSAASPED
jgi:hypothetical protein